MWPFVLTSTGTFLLIASGAQLEQGNDAGFWLAAITGVLFMAGGGGGGAGGTPALAATGGQRRAEK